MRVCVCVCGCVWREKGTVSELHTSTASRMVLLSLRKINMRSSTPQLSSSAEAKLGLRQKLIKQPKVRGVCFPNWGILPTYPNLWDGDPLVGVLLQQLSQEVSQLGGDVDTERKRKRGR